MLEETFKRSKLLQKAETSSTPSDWRYRCLRIFVHVRVRWGFVWGKTVLYFGSSSPTCNLIQALSWWPVIHSETLFLSATWSFLSSCVIYIITAVLICIHRTFLLSIFAASQGTRQPHCIGVFHSLVCPFRNPSLLWTYHPAKSALYKDILITQLLLSFFVSEKSLRLCFFFQRYGLSWLLILSCYW